MIENFNFTSEVIFSVIGSLVMILFGLLLQKINSIDKNSKELERNILDLIDLNGEKIEQIGNKLNTINKEILKSIYKMDLKITKKFVSKNECIKNHTSLRLKDEKSRVI